MTLGTWNVARLGSNMRLLLACRLPCLAVEERERGERERRERHINNEPWEQTPGGFALYTIRVILSSVDTGLRPPSSEDGTHAPVTTRLSSWLAKMAHMRMCGHDQIVVLASRLEARDIFSQLSDNFKRCLIKSIKPCRVSPRGSAAGSDD